MSDERHQLAQQVDEREFSSSKRGYDKVEVRAYLQDLEQVFRDLESRLRRANQRAADLESELKEARVSEKVSVDQAMLAVFEAKDRILGRARQRAQQLEEEAHAAALRIRSGGLDSEEAPDVAAARAEADAIVAAAREEADRIRREAGNEHEQLSARLGELEADLRNARAGATAVGAELDAARSRIVELEDQLAGARAATDDSREPLVEPQPVEGRSEVVTELHSVEAREADDFVRRMTAMQAHFEHQAGTENEAALVRELSRRSGAGVEDARPPSAGDSVDVQAAEERIGDLEAQLADALATAAGLEEASMRAEEIVAAARQEAEDIKADAEEEADQRAAKVIATARAEADQVRQTVATLTAQAEDARSAALRSKLEAEDLAEAQRAMSKARDDIVAAAESRARQLREDAERDAASTREEAEGILAQARKDAERVITDSEQQAQAQLDAAAEQAAGLVRDAELRTEPGEEAAAGDGDEAVPDDLEVLLAETEQDLEAAEELRHRRQELDDREAELERRERALADQQAEAALLLASAREETAAAVAPPPPPSLPDLPPAVPASAAMPSDDGSGAEDELLSALLEHTATGDRDGLLAEDDGPIGADSTEEQGADGEARPRITWPVAMSGESETGDEEPPTRETRYQSRSAQLPHLGDQAKSNLTTMSHMRRKSKGD